MTIFVAVPGFASESMTLKSWPSQDPVSKSIAVQFIDLEFKLPHAMVERVLVFGFNLPNLTIMLDTEHVINIGRKDDFWGVYEALKKKGFFKGLDIHDAESFFDSLAVSPGEPVQEPLKIMRDAFSVEGTEYSKSAKGEFTVYRAIPHKNPAVSTIYILIDGNKTIYQVTGDISDADYAALLSGLARASVL
jgi:hypothetical protein